MDFLELGAEVFKRSNTPLEPAEQIVMLVEPGKCDSGFVLELRIFADSTLALPKPNNYGNRRLKGCSN